MGNLIGLDLMRLDRDVRLASTRVREASRALSRGDIEEGRDPLASLRNVSSKASFDELADLPDDPLVHALHEWIGALTIIRVTWEDDVRVAQAWHAREHRSGDIAGLVSAHDLLAALLREHASSERRYDLAGELARAADRTASAARVRAERRVEAVRRLGSSISEGDPSELDLASIESLAREVLRATELIADRRTRSSSAAPHNVNGPRPDSSWEEAIFEGLGRDAVEGWPAALSSRWLSDLFRGSILVEGLRLDLGTIPEALGASSFCRALGNFGAALSDADLPRDLPFTLARSPLDALRMSRTALFAGLPAEPVFARRALRLARVAARDQARQIAFALARSLRVEALRVLLNGTLLEPVVRANARAQEESATALRAPIASSLLGLVPKLSASDPARFVAICDGIRQRADLRERFDEDWFDNPHAQEALRSAHHQAATTRRPTKESMPPLLSAVQKELTSSWL